MLEQLGWSRARAARWGLRAAPLCVLFTVVAVQPDGTAFGTALPLVTEACALVLFAVAVSRSPAEVRTIWALLLMSQLLVLAGDVVFDLDEARNGEAAFPGWPDALYLASYTAEVCALIAILRRRRVRPRVEDAIDAAVIAAPIVALVLMLAIGPALSAWDGSAASVLSALYPAIDLVLLGLLLRLSVGDGGRVNRSMALLLASISCTLVADLVYNALISQDGAAAVPGWLDGLYSTGMILMAAAALSRDSRRILESRHVVQGHPSAARTVAFAVSSMLLPVLLLLLPPAAMSLWARPAIAVVLLTNVLILARALLVRRYVEDQEERLERLARTDGLTGLANRRTFDFELERTAERAQASGEPFCVALMDLDWFKRINDEHGHAAGDDVLRACATRWAYRLSGSGFLARYGGEEFAVILPRCDSAAARSVLGELRRATPDPVTVSIGYASLSPGMAGPEVLAAADEALYAAKAAGRDRIVAADDLTLDALGWPIQPPP